MALNSNGEDSTAKGVQLQATTKTDNNKDPEADEEVEYEWVPPDGGWGWLVLSGSVVVSMLIPGTIKSFGILFVEFFEVFDASPVAASWIPALTYFLYCSLGPLASYLSTKYSYRTVTLLGGLFAATGMISSVFATNITHLYICYGLLVGTGAGLSFPPGVFIVTSYFVRLRGLANGIAISGSALGSIILPPFLRYLLENYGFRGAVLIVGGLILNVLVGASLYDPVQQHLKKVPIEKSKKNGKHSEVYYVSSNKKDKKNGEIKNLAEEKALLDSVIFESKEVPIEKDEIILEYHPSNTNKNVLTQPLILVEGSTNVISKNGGSRISLGRMQGNPESNQQISRKISTGSYRDRGRVMGSTSQISRKTSVTRPLHRVASAATMTRKVSVASNLSSSSFRYISTPFHGSTLVGLNPEFSSQITMKTPQETQQPSSAHSWISSLCCCFSRNKSKETKESSEQKGMYRTLLSDNIFIMILISNASTAIGYTNFTILLPTYAVSLGFDKDMASYLLSVVSMFDLMGRVGGSALSDWLPISKKFYYIGGLVLSGISLVLLPLFHDNYTSLAFFCGAFGLFSGTFVGIQAIYMADMLGEDRLASSYGVSLFINGILQLVGPPICGVFKEIMNSYGPIVTALGIVLICGASVWTYFPFVNKKKSDTFGA